MPHALPRRPAGPSSNASTSRTKDKLGAEQSGAQRQQQQQQLSTTARSKAEPRETRAAFSPFKALCRRYRRYRRYRRGRRRRRRRVWHEHRAAFVSATDNGDAPPSALSISRPLHFFLRLLFSSLPLGDRTRAPISSLLCCARPAPSRPSRGVSFISAGGRRAMQITAAAGASAAGNCAPAPVAPSLNYDNDAVFALPSARRSRVRRASPEKSTRRHVHVENNRPDRISRDGARARDLK